ncbi:MAG: hypothetical protein CFE24_05070, partial [Flavobacterium sp. BFFFF2]
ENEPKERAFLARIKGHFCLRQNQFRLAENPSKASRFFAASETYDYICGPVPVKLRRKVNIDLKPYFVISTKEKRKFSEAKSHHHGS